MTGYQSLLNSLDDFSAPLPLLGRAPEQIPTAPPSVGDAELFWRLLGNRALLELAMPTDLVQ